MSSQGPEPRSDSTYRLTLAAVLGIDGRRPRTEVGGLIRLAKIHTGEDSGADQGGSNGGGEKWLDSGGFLIGWIWSVRERTFSRVTPRLWV